MLPLQFPQAIAVSGYRDKYAVLTRVGLLLSRMLTGLVMGFAKLTLGEEPSFPTGSGTSSGERRPREEELNF